MKEPFHIAIRRIVAHAILKQELPHQKFTNDIDKAGTIICMRYDDWCEKVKQYGQSPMSNALSLKAAPVCRKCKARVVMVDTIFEHYKANPKKMAVCNYCIEGFNEALYGTAK